ncbi:MAG: BON domain-containing protein [Gemmataceae bacterium]
MTHMFRRFTRYLLVAGGCSLATFSLMATPVRAQAPAGLTATLNVTPSQARLEAMKAEVALLGDPVTLKLPLTVAVDRDTLVLKGHVPDETARRRVLEVARQSCYLPVRDALTIPCPAPVDSVALRTASRDTLVRHLGPAADRLVVTVQEGGQVKVEGDVSSVEQKLEVSRALRSVIGCSRIINCLSVHSGDVAGQPITLISGDVIEGESGTTLPVGNLDSSRGSVRIVPVQATDTISPPLPRIVTTQPTTVPQPRVVSVNSTQTTRDASRPVLYVPPTGNYAAMPTGTAAPTVLSATPSQVVPTTPGVVQGAVVSTPVAGSNCGCNTHGKQQQRPSLMDRMTAWKNSRSNRQGQVVTGVVPSSTTVVGTTATPQQLTPLPATGVTQMPQVLTPAQPSGGSRIVSGRTVSGGRRTGTTSTTVVPQPTLAPQPTLVPQATPTLTAPVQTESPLPPATGPKLSDASTPGAQPTQVTTAGFQSRPLAGVASRQQPPTPPTQPAAATTTTPSAAPNQAFRLSEADLIQRVKEACGELSRGVRVEQTKDQIVQVHVIAQPASEHLLVARLLQVPELGARNVQLHVHTAK